MGAGGKSTLVRALAGELSAGARVIVATSTKMFVPDWCPVVLCSTSGGPAARKGGVALSADESGSMASTLASVEAAFSESDVVCVGSAHEPTEKLQSPGLDFSELAGIADYVLVEADGARHLPLKAHESREPVIPECAARVVCVAGVDGVGEPISRACHRPRRFAQLAGVSEDAPATVEAVAAVLNAESLHDVVFINKVESAEQRETAAHLASLLNTPAVAGSLWRNEFRCLR